MSFTSYSLEELRAIGKSQGGSINDVIMTMCDLAMSRYFEVFEKQTPDFTARVWLGEKYAGQAKFKGRSPDYQEIMIPMILDKFSHEDWVQIEASSAQVGFMLIDPPKRWQPEIEDASAVYRVGQVTSPITNL